MGGCSVISREQDHQLFTQVLLSLPVLTGNHGTGRLVGYNFIVLASFPQEGVLQGYIDRVWQLVPKNFR